MTNLSTQSVPSCMLLTLAWLQ
uniref:Uncharacterized protein n=1 Tax=Anguilla anguilla TaxID=7936 RepID=A0A0E9VN61_ANGAN